MKLGNQSGDGRKSETIDEFVHADFLQSSVSRRRNKRPNVNFLVNSGFNSKLRIRKKIYEFYNSPVTKFWQYFILYMTFLLIFTYTVLIRTPMYPAWNEIVVLVYIYSFGLDKFREVKPRKPSVSTYNFAKCLISQSSYNAIHRIFRASSRSSSRR